MHRDFKVLAGQRSLPKRAIAGSISAHLRDSRAVWPSTGSYKFRNLWGLIPKFTLLYSGIYDIIQV
jgi:hypothetical protein